MHCHCGTNNRAPRWTFTNPCKPEARPGAREESASPAWLDAPAMNARDRTKIVEINQWTNAYIIFASIYTNAHPSATSDILVFKYMYNIRLGASRNKGL